VDPPTLAELGAVEVKLTVWVALATVKETELVVAAVTPIASVTLKVTDEAD
jgi:hypothetical protein